MISVEVQRKVKILNYFRGVKNYIHYTSINCPKYVQIFHKYNNIIFFLGFTNEHTKAFGDLLHVIRQN